jgi:hypothetical protein
MCTELVGALRWYAEARRGRGRGRGPRRGQSARMDRSALCSHGWGAGGRRAQGLGFRVRGLELKIWGSRLGVEG